MNKKKIIIIIICVLILVGGFGTYLYLTKEDANTSLNIIEKKWVDNNKKKLLDISIFNDIPVLNYHGEGVVFDFLNSLESDTGLEFNRISYAMSDAAKTDYAFQQKDSVDDNDILLYQDNYVLVTLNGKVYNTPSEMKNITVGVLNKDLDKINSYLLGSNVSFRTYDSVDTMFSSLLGNTNDTVDAIAIPKLQYLENIVKDTSLTIGYNITEYKTNYVLTLSTNSDYSTLNSILTKYYTKWSNNNFTSKFNNYLISDYFTFTGGESQNTAKFHSKRYVYGFVNNKPYDVLSDGDLVGINSSFIKEFTKLSSVVVEYKEFSSIEDMVNAFNANEIDFFLQTNKATDYKMDTYTTISPFNEDLVVLTNVDKNIQVNSVNSLSNYTVSVLKDSIVEEYLTSYGINVKEFDTMSSLMKNTKSDVIAIDSYNYQYYVQKGIKDYRFSYTCDLASNYNYIFRDISENKQFEKLFNFYLTFNSNNQIINEGISNTVNISTTVLIIKNILIIISCIVIIGIIVLIVKKVNPKNRKKHTNLSKGDKIKYIDRLTSLKNRNYLNDNIEMWDDSEVYPQTIVVVDLNDVAYINDNYGHAEGDLVIKAAANILIKNQLANSEIIRTNGNEFLIYLVSYDEKQVVAYIRKLNKEFKELAHGFGAAIGYSVINDAIKTIDDAVNEATIDMRNNKEELSKD